MALFVQASSPVKDVLPFAGARKHGMYKWLPLGSRQRSAFAPLSYVKARFAGTLANSESSSRSALTSLVRPVKRSAAIEFSPWGVHSDSPSAPAQEAGM